jgi:hypothetical protein
MLRVLVVGMIAFELFLLLGNYRVLISEKFIPKGENAYVEGWGSIDGNQRQDSLVCEYFDGRKIVKSVMWYSPNNIFGVSGCHILEKW